MNGGERESESESEGGREGEGRPGRKPQGAAGSSAGQRIVDALPFGTTYVSPRRSLSEGECGVLISLTWLHSPMHADREHAKRSLLGDLVLPGVLLVPLAMGLVIGQTQQFREALGISGVAELSVTASFHHPTYLRDTITATTTFTAARVSASRPGHVVATLEHGLYNQRDETLMKMEKVTLYKGDERYEVAE